MAIPKISIIVPVYNAEAYLAECLDSIINQTLMDVEIICVNDGTKDNSVKILEDYQRKDNRILIVHKENGGLSSARNAGMKVAKGEYIGFVDSDDFIDGDFFEKLYLIAKENSADMAMGNVEYYYSDEIREKELTYITKYMNGINTDIVTDPEDRKKVIGASVVWNKIYSREFLEKNQFLFYEGLYWEDNPFSFMTSVKANKIILVRDVVYYNRKHSTSITSTASFDRKPFDMFEIVSRIKLFVDKEGRNFREGYNHFFEDRLFIYYFDHLQNRIHKRFKREFYYRVQEEFRKIDEDGSNYLSSKYKMFTLIKNSTYLRFRIIYRLYPLIRIINYKFPNVVRLLSKFS